MNRPPKLQASSPEVLTVPPGLQEQDWGPSQALSAIETMAFDPNFVAQEQLALRVEVAPEAFIADDRYARVLQLCAELVGVPLEHLDVPEPALLAEGATAKEKAESLCWLAGWAKHQTATHYATKRLQELKAGGQTVQLSLEAKQAPYLVLVVDGQPLIKAWNAESSAYSLIPVDDSDVAEGLLFFNEIMQSRGR